MCCECECPPLALTNIPSPSTKSFSSEREGGGGSRREGGRREGERDLLVAGQIVLPPELLGRGVVGYVVYIVQCT